MQKKSSKNRWGLIILLLFLSVSLLVSAGCQGRQEKPKPKPETVKATENADKNTETGGEGTITKISPEEASKMLEGDKDGKIVVLDVRPAGEFMEGHVKNALNIDVKGPDFMKEIKKLDRDAVYVVYCKKGKKSALASDKMKAEGFKKIYDVKGGMNKWKEANLPLEN